MAEERDDAPREEPEATEEQAPAETEEQAPEANEEQAPEATATPEATEEPVPEAEADAPEAEAKPAEAKPAEAKPAESPQQKPRGKGKQKKGEKPEVIPGEHLEPDLVLEEERAPAGPGAIAAAEAASATETEDTEAGPEDGAQPEAPEAPTADEPAERSPLDLAADARYQATGKRKRAIARVILKPGSGAYTINGRQLDEFFPRRTLQQRVRQPLEAAGYTERMDVVAKIHGGGVSSQAGALRHGVARALVEADPNLRGDLKREGHLTRDPRVKERKKAGLKKARKRPQFSKR